MNFKYFTGAVGEQCEIWLICSNFLEFSVDGQKSESSEFRSWMDFSAKFMGFVGEWSEFRLIRWNFREFFVDGQASESIMYSGSINGANFASFTGFWGELCEICIIRWKFLPKDKM